MWDKAKILSVPPPAVSGLPIYMTGAGQCQNINSSFSTRTVLNIVILYGEERKSCSNKNSFYFPSFRSNVNCSFLSAVALNSRPINTFFSVGRTRDWTASTQHNALLLRWRLPSLLTACQLTEGTLGLSNGGQNLPQVWISCNITDDNNWYLTDIYIFIPLISDIRGQNASSLQGICLFDMVKFYLFEDRKV